jgi:ABC-type transport system substrate-binding protein
MIAPARRRVRPKSPLSKVSYALPLVLPLRLAMMILIRRCALALPLFLGPLPSMAAPLPNEDPTPPAAFAAIPAEAKWSHAYAAYGQPKYPRGFTHFDYVNPDAPKGGTLQESQPDRRTSFDKFNPFTIKGNSPAALGTLMFETLAVRSGDEPDVMYGLLAEDIQVAPDKSWIAFRMNPKARFTNGDPVTAADAKYSFDMLRSKEAAPQYRTQLEGVAGVHEDYYEDSVTLLSLLVMGGHYWDPTTIGP